MTPVEVIFVAPPPDLGKMVSLTIALTKLAGLGLALVAAMALCCKPYMRRSATRMYSVI